MSVVIPSPDSLSPAVLRRLLRQQLYLALLLGVIVWFIYEVREILPVFLFAFILAYLLGPLVRRVAGPDEKRLSRSTAALLVYLALVALLGALGYLLFHALQGEVKSYMQHYNEYRSALLVNLTLEEQTGFLHALPASAQDALNNLVINSDQILSDFASKTIAGLVKTAPRLLEMVAVPIVAYYFLADYRRFIEFMRRLVRPGGRERFDTLIHEINDSLRGYIVGQAILSAVAAVAATLILTFNNVHPALVVGLAAFFLELIPVVGPLAWALAAIVLTYVQNPSQTIVVAILVLIAHQSDMHILAPRILGSHLRLHPAVVIFALLAGNALMGILGVLLAAPLAATINITLTYLITEGALSHAAVIAREENPESTAEPIGTQQEADDARAEPPAPTLMPKKESA